ncbi:MAG: ABC transporter permease [Acidobacteriota bacterium]
MTRRLSLFLATLGAMALAAPWLAPYNADTQHRAFLHAPPMAPRLIDEHGVHAPFVYAITLTDRMAQRYEVDRQRTLPLPWLAAAAAPPVFLLGADSFGRDMLSRLLHGTRVSVSLALASMLGALVLGALFGGLAGFRGGLIDDMIMRSADFVVVLPMMYVALVLRAMLPLVLAPATVFVLMSGIFAIAGWPFVSRGVRNIVVAEREREYVTAARSLGAGNWRILTRHLLPACGSHLLVQATVLLPAFILAEATLSYVGLGFPESVATWGTMLAEAANVSAMTRFPWTLAPAGAIFLVVLATNLTLESDKITHRPL